MSVTTQCHVLAGILLLEAAVERYAAGTVVDGVNVGGQFRPSDKQEIQKVDDPQIDTGQLQEYVDLLKAIDSAELDDKTALKIRKKIRQNIRDSINEVRNDSLIKKTLRDSKQLAGDIVALMAASIWGAIEDTVQADAQRQGVNQTIESPADVVRYTAVEEAEYLKGQATGLANLAKRVTTWAIAKVKNDLSTYAAQTEVNSQDRQQAVKDILSKSQQQKIETIAREREQHRQYLESLPARLPQLNLSRLPNFNSAQAKQQVNQFLKDGGVASQES